MADRFELLRREFPEYPVDSLPEIPADWEDVSWHNDACPSFSVPTREGDDLRIFIDYPDPKLSDFGDGRVRFGANFYPNDWQSNTDVVNIYEGDDWEALLAALAVFDPASLDDPERSAPQPELPLHQRLISLADQAFPDEAYDTEEGIDAANGIWSLLDQLSPETFGEGSDFALWGLKATHQELILRAFELAAPLLGGEAAEQLLAWRMSHGARPAAEPEPANLSAAARALLFESLDWQSALGYGARPSLDQAISDLGVALMINDPSRSEPIQALEREFSAYVAQERLPEGSADELIHGDLSEPQRRFISDFIRRWEAAEAEEARLAEAFAKWRASGRDVADLRDHADETQHYPEDYPEPVPGRLYEAGWMQRTAEGQWWFPVCGSDYLIADLADAERVLFEEYVVSECGA